MGTNKFVDKDGKEIQGAKAIVPATSRTVKVNENNEVVSDSSEGSSVSMSEAAIVGEDGISVSKKAVVNEKNEIVDKDTGEPIKTKAINYKDAKVAS